ncbi:MAG: radical SAM protein [Acidobacteria bacterium]|nr:radical SAM protein [Acidobacteriota bacterium]MBI3658464.1 radical SAM protein [Acidobacteriota bacterium]
MNWIRKPLVAKRRVNIFLIKPSNYDDDGFVVTYFRGVLPSNTLSCLAALTREVIEKKTLGEDIDVHVRLFDETVQKIPVQKICRSARDSQHRTIVALVGVQSNQFPRAADLARQFRAGGCTVMIGGFHVSGYMAMLPEIPQEIQSLLEQGVTIVKGEVEETWGMLLQDAVQGRLKPLYDFIDDKPDLYNQPIPLIDTRLLRHFMASNFGTIDCGRGCPFNCSFCTIINVQGRKMRVRSAECIAQAVRQNWRQNKVDYYFFTDDNFARNIEWERIFDALIDLREKENIDVRFMMQVDVLSYKIPQFVEKARRAGCTQVFIGMESINPESLKDAQKAQNQVADYVRLIQAWHEVEIATHVGYILGFPSDTPESIRRDLQRLINEIKVEQASFFILTPLPGSRDHFEIKQSGEYMDSDHNRFDSTHETMKYANFPEPGSLTALYLEAWATFYSFENMKRVLQRAAPRNYWNILRNFIWYKNAIMLEGRHPMMAGFFRRKSRSAVRPNVPVPSWWAFFKTRSREIRTYLLGMARLIMEMEELWLQTRRRSEAELCIVEEMRRLHASVRRRLNVAEMQLAHARARLQVPSIRVPTKLALYWQKWHLWLGSRKVYTRADLQDYWESVKHNLHEKRIFHISPLRVLTSLWLDFQVTLMFAFAILRAR